MKTSKLVTIACTGFGAGASAVQSFKDAIETINYKAIVFQHQLINNPDNIEQAYNVAKEFAEKGSAYTSVFFGGVAAIFSAYLLNTILHDKD